MWHRCHTTHLHTPDQDWRFREVRRLAGWAIIPLGFLGALCAGVIAGESTVRFDWVMAVAAAILAGGGVLSIALLHIELKIGKSQIEYAMSPFFRRKISASEIRHVRLVDFPSREIGMGRGATWRIEGGAIVEVELNKGRSVHFSSAHARSLREAIQEMVEENEQRKTTVVRT